MRVADLGSRLCGLWISVPLLAQVEGSSALGEDAKRELIFVCDHTNILFVLHGGTVVQIVTPRILEFSLPSHWIWGDTNISDRSADARMCGSSILQWRRRNPLYLWSGRETWYRRVRGFIHASRYATPCLCPSRHCGSWQRAICQVGASPLSVSCTLCSPGTSGTAQTAGTDEQDPVYTESSKWPWLT